MQLSEELLLSLKNIKGFDEETFKKVHESGVQVTSVRINVNKFSIFDSQLSIESKIPWSEYGYYLKERPSFTFDPLFHAGCYYVQEASSMFLEQALKQLVDLSTPIKILDLCAAPGGKSTHIQSLISKGSLLVSNEVIRSRVNILKDNIIKWGVDNVVVTNNDPKDFSRLENYFDVIVVDAPCSGSGLFRREPEAIEEWSENNVMLCSQRQQRILADVWPALKKDGLLIYSTCSYSKEEDEEVIEWLTKELPAEKCKLQIDEEWGIIESEGGYRFWPDKLKGEGFFIACLKKKDGGEWLMKKSKNKPEQLTKKESSIIENWVKKDTHQFVRNADIVHAVPEIFLQDIFFLLNNLRVQYYGVLVGQLIRDKLVPDHAFAMSKMVNESVSRTALSDDEAIAYLQKKDLGAAITGKGWQLVTYGGQQLGWINVLPNRINNYYPKELRILKEK